MNFLWKKKTINNFTGNKFLLTFLKGLKKTKNEIKMATRQQFELSTAERRKRTFSEDFKRQKVREIEPRSL